MYDCCKNFYEWPKPGHPFLPKEFRVSTDEVFLKKTSAGFTVVERDPWEMFAEGCRELSEDFMVKRVQPPLEKRRWK